MAVVISMLRGINLAKHGRIKMDALRALYESLGLQEPQTYIQSGNVLFKTKERDLAALARRIQKGVEWTFAFHTEVILRTASNLKSVVARNPFAARRDIDPRKLLITFLASDPTSEARENLLKINADPEELRIDGCELYIYFPNGLARPKLSLALVEKTIKVPATGRNWNSVTKLLEMAERLELSSGKS